MVVSAYLASRNALYYDDRQKQDGASRVRKFLENYGSLRRRANKEKARLIEKICKAGGASPRHRLIRIRVSFGLWFRLRVVGCHQEATEKPEREKERGYEQGNTSRERPREKESGTVREGSGLEHSQSSD